MPDFTHFVRYGHDINIFSQGLGFMSQAEKANIKSAGSISLCGLRRAL